MIKSVLAKILFAFFLLSATTIEAQIFKKKNKKTEKAAEKPKNGKIQPYDKVITKDTKTDKGLFDVHVVNDKQFYEIPDSLLNKEMLMVTTYMRKLLPELVSVAAKSTPKYYVGKRKEKKYCFA